MEARLSLSFRTSSIDYKERRTTSDIANGGFPYRPLAIQEIASLVLRPQDRERADAPRTDPAFAPVGASRAVFDFGAGAPVTRPTPFHSLNGFNSLILVEFLSL